MSKFLPIVFILLLQLNFGFAFNTIILDDNVSKIDVSNYLSYYPDSSSALTLQQLIEEPDKYNFQKIVGSPVNLGVSNNTYWFMFDLENKSSRQDWIMEIDYPTLNEVTFYFLDSINQPDTIIYSGKNQIDKNGKSYTYSIVLTPPFQKGEMHRVFIKIKTESFIILPISIMSASTFIEKDRKEFSFLYLLYGIILALIAFNFILFLLTRELNYLLLTIYLAILSLNAFYMYGYGFDLLPNLDIFLKNRMRQVLFGIGSSIFLIFTINYLELKKYKALYQIIIALIGLSMVYTISLFFRELSQALYSKYSPYLYLSGAIINFFAGIYSYRKGERLALYYIISFSFVTIAALIYYLTLFNIIPFNQIAFNINSLGTVLFGLLLTIGLIEKITAIRQEKAKSNYLETMVNKLNSEIDERNKVEKALRDSEERFRLLFELSPQAISLTEMETGLIFDLNHQMEELAGWTKQEIIGKTSLEIAIIDSDDRKSILKKLQNSPKILGFELDLHPANQDPVRCLAYIHLIEIQGKNILISVFSDISDLKRKQHEIKMLSTALQQSANAVVITNTNGIIEYVNSSLLGLTGYSRDEVIGRTSSLFKSLHYLPSDYKTLWETILSGQEWKGEFYNRKKDGDYFWDFTTISPVFDETGKITNFIAVKEDITEKRQQQDALKLSEVQLRELNATKDKFFSIIAHDLMNPFNALLGFSGLLLEALKDNKLEEGLNFASIIDHSSHKIFDLFQNLLVWSRTQSGQISYNPMSIRVIELVMNTMNVLKDVALGKQIDLEIELQENDTIFADQNMISTVLRNLTSNAIKFSEQGTKVKISAKKQDKYYLFQVTDAGLGIDDQMINDLFNLEKNISTHGSNGEVGTGLGLVICYDFVHAHGGEIWAESELGKGSRFFFTIPQK